MAGTTFSAVRSTRRVARSLEASELRVTLRRQSVSLVSRGGRAEFPMALRVLLHSGPYSYGGCMTL